MFKVAGELLEGVEAGIEKSSNSIKFVNFKWIQDWNPIRKSGRSVKYFTYVEVKQMESNLKFLIHKWVYTWGGAQEGEQVDESKATIGGLYRSWPHQPTWRESLLRCIYKKKGGGVCVCVCVIYIWELLKKVFGMINYIRRDFKSISSQQSVKAWDEKQGG